MQEQIVIKSDNSIILTAPVMIPGAKDCDYWRGEKPFTVDQVRAFKEAYDEYGFIDKHHAIQGTTTASKNELIGKALKSFLLTETTSFTWFDGTVHTYPTGTWMLTSEINDPVAIKAVYDGLITGYSPSVFKRETAERIRAALKSEPAVLKASAGGLIKDITDPVPAVVSLVRKPCQHGNKFCKNNVGDNMSEDKAQSKLDKISEILGFKETPEYATKEDLDAVSESIESAFKSDEFKEFLGSMVKEAVLEATKDMALKEDSEEKPEDETKDETDESAEEKPDEKEDGAADEEQSDEKEKSGLKEDSKALPQHDNNGEKPAMKSDKAIVMEQMGRNLRGRPLKE